MLVKGLLGGRGAAPARGAVLGRRLVLALGVGLGLSGPMAVAATAASAAAAGSAAAGAERAVAAQFPAGRLPVIAPQGLAQIAGLLAEKARRTPAQAKLDSHLLYAVRAARGEAPAAGVDLRRAMAATVGVDARQRVAVEVRGEVGGALLGALAGLGAESVVAHAELGSLRASLPLARLEEAAALPGVRFIGPLPQRSAAAGPDGSGDVAHAANLVRVDAGIAGAGVRVGVISTGVTSLAAQQAAGSLPGNVTVLPGLAGSGDEGTAVLEVIYTLAPAAQLYFATSGATDADMAAAIAALQAAGCQIIVDDITFYDEPAFQDGPIAQAVDAFTNGGGLYVSSAGNDGNLDSGTAGVWEGDFVAATASIAAVSASDTGVLHSFGAADHATLVAGTKAWTTLEWSDPLGASANDYDLFLLSGDLTTVIDYSTNVQNGTQDPYEHVGTTSAGEALVVVQHNGAARYLRLAANLGRLSPATAGATAGHNGGAATVSVAAVNVTYAGGGAFAAADAAPIASYSSDGPRRLFFTPAGAAITPGNFLAASGGGSVLPKVDLTAATCVPTTVTGYAQLCGTSAAAPHVAAIGALALSLPSHPSPAQVRVALEQSALDMGAAGFDRDWGHGIAMADATIGYLAAPPAVRFYTVTPCRAVDTRTAAGPLGGPALQANAVRAFTLTGACGIPAGAKAVAANVTVVVPGAAGDLRFYAGDDSVAPLASTINFGAGALLANNAMLQLAHDGSGTVNVQSDATAPVDLLIDVNGYYQ